MTDKSIESKMLHYLYFPDEVSAKKAVQEIKKQKGFDCLYRLGADGINWLVLVKHRLPITQTEFNKFYEILKRITNAYMGEYDGWEIPMN